MNPIVAKIVIPLVTGSAVVGAGIGGYHMLTAEEGYRVISAYQLEGRAYVERPTIGEMDVYENMFLASGDISWTEEESYLYLSLDNSEYLMMEPDTVISLEASGSGESTKTHIYLEQGAIINRLDDPLNPDETYEITTPNSTMAVRGTEFRVEVVYDEENISHTELSVYEGKVDVRLKYPDGTIDEQPVTMESGVKARMWGSEVTSDYEYAIEDAVEYDTLSTEGINFLLKGTQEGGHQMSISMEELQKLLELNPNMVVVNGENGIYVESSEGAEVWVFKDDADQMVVVPPGTEGAELIVVDGATGAVSSPNYVYVEGDANATGVLPEGAEVTKPSDGSADSGAAGDENNNANTAGNGTTGQGGAANPSTPSSSSDTNQPSQDSVGDQPSDQQPSDTPANNNDNSDDSNTPDNSDDEGSPSEDENSDSPADSLIEDNEEGTYIVSFFYNGELFCQQVVKAGETATRPALSPSSTGKWNFNFSKAINGDTSIYWTE